MALRPDSIESVPEFEEYYTDSVTESLNDFEQEFGEDRLIDVLRRKRSLPAQELALSVVEEVQSFSAKKQHHDITLIVAKGK